jgi:hypothetical protein
MTIELAQLIIAALSALVVSLVAIVWKSVSGEQAASRNYRHHKAPALFAEVHKRVDTVEDQVAQHDWRIVAHDTRLNKIEK